MLPSGTVVTANETSSRDLLDAARVGMGAFGVLSEITFAVFPLWTMERILAPVSLTALLPQLPALRQQYERLQWYYTPYTDDAFLLLRVNTTAPISGCWNGTANAPRLGGPPGQRAPLPVWTCRTAR